MALPERRRRCAVYTRKSTDEGLEQDFNSLHAQREACEAYVLSQRSEGWKLVPTAYDDGGFSGGSLDRPGLKQLLADVHAGKVDVIVVYKVDRLTRALSDFARIVDVLDAAGASFVSVTQAFNTTTSMGRLTLNVLLSFAQFEREVTAERIRDKIAASKAKGMWMGGLRPLGYRGEDHQLHVVPAEADTVRHIFARFVVLRSVDALAAELDREDIRSAVRISKSGHRSGGVRLVRGALYQMLGNPVYRGMIRHKQAVHQGHHVPIIDQALWDEVQAVIAANRVDRRDRVNVDHPSLLAGLLSDQAGRPMSPSHTCRASKRYRYYQTHPQHLGTSGVPAMRLSAGDLEPVVVAQLCTWLRRPDAADAFSIAGIGGISPVAAVIAADRWAGQLESAPPSMQRTMLATALRHIQVQDGTIVMTLDLAGVGMALGLEQISNDTDAALPVIRFDYRVARIGKQMKLVVRADAASAVCGDTPLIRIVAKAHAARQLWMRARGKDDAGIAAQIGCSRAYLRTLLRISFLAPDITALILDGRQPAGLGEQTLLRATRLPIDWTQQRQLLGVG